MHAECQRQEGARSPRILVVEDNLVNRKLAVALVERWGFDSFVAKDGQEALDLLATEHVDLILMDVQMPILDGLEATRAIRAQEAERGGHIPIVALTAHAYMRDRDKCFDAGMDEFLTKPIDHGILHETILRLLQECTEATSNVAAEVAREDVVDPPAGPGETGVPQFDLQEATSRVDGDQELLGEIAVLFLESSETWLEDLRGGSDDSGAVVIERAAHTLKGSAASFGAGSVVESALRVERIAASGNLAGIDVAVRELEARVQALNAELRSFLEERSS